MLRSTDIHAVVEAMVQAATDPPTCPPEPEPASVRREVLIVVEVAGTAYELTRVMSPRAGELSPRELEIVRLVAAGRPNKSIAEALDISPWTVATHLRRIFTKLGVRSRAQMVASVFDIPAPTGGLDRGPVDGATGRRADTSRAVGPVVPRG